MKPTDTVVAVFADHAAADKAVKSLASSGFDIKNLSVVGKGYHTEEKAVGFYNIGDRMKVWGSRGVLWGGLWGLFFGGLFLTLPVVGHVIVLGYLAALIASALEGAVVVGGISVIGAALTSIGIPKDSVMTYETAIKTDSFLVLVHGTAQEMQRARSILDAASAFSVDAYDGVMA
ncbi:MAG: DUF1269 domain-containing protein [Gemmatimonadaceae bacterium]|nr:DUF1269 domain-containing protein [Caulobacter sp.]